MSLGIFFLYHQYLRKQAIWCCGLYKTSKKLHREAESMKLICSVLHRPGPLSESNTCCPFTWRWVACMLQSTLQSGPLRVIPDWVTESIMWWLKLCSRGQLRAFSCNPRLPGRLLLLPGQPPLWPCPLRPSLQPAHPAVGSSSCGRMEPGESVVPRGQGRQAGWAVTGLRSQGILCVPPWFSGRN